VTSRRIVAGGRSVSAGTRRMYAAAVRRSSPD